MSNAVKIVLAVVVLGLGAAGAWRFRKSPDPSSSSGASLPDRPNLRKPGNRNANWDDEGWRHAPPPQLQTQPPLASIAAPDGFPNTALTAPPLPLPHPSAPRPDVSSPLTGNDCRGSVARPRRSAGLDDGGWRTIKASGGR